MSTIEPEGPKKTLFLKMSLRVCSSAGLLPSPQKLSISESQTVIIGRWETQTRRRLRQSSPKANTR